MIKYTIAALGITAIALTPLAAFAFADQAEVESYCSQEAAKEGVAADKLEAYIADCVSTNMEAEKELKSGGEGEGEGEKSE